MHDLVNVPDVWYPKQPRDQRSHQDRRSVRVDRDDTFCAPDPRELHYTDQSSGGQLRKAQGLKIAPTQDWYADANGRNAHQHEGGRQRPGGNVPWKDDDWFHSAPYGLQHLEQDAVGAVEGIRWVQQENLLARFAQQAQ
jgi:hypothetical protein